MSDSQLYPSNLYLSNMTKLLWVIYFKTCRIWTLVSYNRSNRKHTIRNNNIFVLNRSCNKWIPATCSGSGRHIGYLYLHESCHVFRFWETYWIFIHESCHVFRFRETYWIFILTCVLSHVQVQGDILDIYTYMSPVTCSGSGRHIGFKVFTLNGRRSMAEKKFI